MKLISFLSIATFLFALASCQKDEVIVQVPDSGPNPGDTTTLAVTVLKTGMFTGQNSYQASGTAQIIHDINQQHFVRLVSDFKTSFATGSVTMYLSKNSNLQLSDATSLHKLAVINTNGSHNFAISPNQVNEFQFVIIWCAPAGIQFGRAELK
ncbi:MAG: DM13 domain-containing protein [Saprospiraceae bacterium]|nr:DM13 domain-containing protein [Saprospiraceae bacterium]MDZ4705883.1 DM13 domain-containing protein [Saprospiraceae bacterium]